MYQFSINDRLNDLLLKALLQLGMVNKEQPVTFDYDNQFIANEKYDATYSYKKANGYFPGIAQINLHPFYIENRDGNANVKFEQAETLERAFAQLKANGIKVDKARMDCGSYSQEVVEVASCNSNTFYIRAMSWKYLPFSFMKENTVFMILTALIRNFYVWLVGEIAANKAFGLEATSRVKKFVFRFVQVLFR